MALHNGMTLRNMSLVLLWTETVTPGMTPEGTQGHIKARGALSLGPALMPEAQIKSALLFCFFLKQG